MKAGPPAGNNETSDDDSGSHETARASLRLKTPSPPLAAEVLRQVRQLPVAVPIGVVADVGAVVLLLREGISTLSVVFLAVTAVWTLDAFWARDRIRATIALVLIMGSVVTAASAGEINRATSEAERIPFMDGGTLVHVYEPNAAEAKKCTTAFSVAIGRDTYMVTAAQCILPGPATIATSDDEHILASNVNCRLAVRIRCVLPNHPRATDDLSLQVAAFQPDSAKPNYRIQAKPAVPIVAVLNSISAAQAIADGNSTACHYGLGSSEHYNEQANQCGRLLGTLPAGTTLGGKEVGGLGQLEAYGYEDGDLGGPVYVYDSTGHGVYILGVVVAVVDVCDASKCRPRVLFSPTQAVETALHGRLYTSQ